MGAFRKELYRLVEPVEDPTAAERSVDYILIATIIVSVATLILGTVESVNARWSELFKIIDLVAVTVFSIEYVARLLTSDLHTGARPGWLGRLAFAFTPLMIIDLLAILPFFITPLGSGFVVLRLIRLLYLLRVLKLARYSPAMRLVKTAVKSRLPELGITLLVTSILILIGSSLLYYAENRVQPEVFTSIPASMWCAVSLVSPQGFGGMIPVTGLGKLTASLLSIVGVGLVALPAGILASAFSTAIAERKAHAERLGISGNRLPEPPPNPEERSDA